MQQPLNNESGQLTELSLFSGAGGGLLATKHLLGWRTLGYVEFNDYCQRVIAARIKDGLLDGAPIFGDIRSFISEGYAASYTGMVDVVTGGFPCQPFSEVGSRNPAEHERNMWPATLEVIRIVRPKWAFLENVTGLYSTGYFATVLEGLAGVGMDALWGVFSACSLGAPHSRERVFLLAYPNQQRLQASGQKRNRDGYQMVERGKGIKYVLEASISACGKGKEVWASEPKIPRILDGVANRVERNRAIGNGQVPAVAATAWHILSGSK